LTELCLTTYTLQFSNTQRRWHTSKYHMVKFHNIQPGQISQHPVLNGLPWYY